MKFYQQGTLFLTESIEFLGGRDVHSRSESNSKGSALTPALKRTWISALRNCNQSHAPEVFIPEPDALHGADIPGRLSANSPP
jgi:hypothetical protein